MLLNYKEKIIIIITENDSLVTDDRKLATIDNYTSIIENPAINPDSLNYADNKNKKEIVENIVKNFGDHSSIIKIKDTNTDTDLLTHNRGYWNAVSYVACRHMSPSVCRLSSRIIFQGRLLI